MGRIGFTGAAQIERPLLDHARGGKFPGFKVGDRVISKQFGNHGVVTEKHGSRYLVRWDDGKVSGGGFGGFNLRPERSLGDSNV